MGDKDPPPFGYTFTDFFDGDPAPFDNSHSLLTDTESQSIADFFTNTNPFNLADSHPFSAAADPKDSYTDFNDWSSFVTPATVHSVSSRIPDQPTQHNDFYNPTFAQPPMPTPHLGNTQDDLQAAETLFNTQSSYNAGRSHSFNGMPSSSRSNNLSSPVALGPGGKPLVVTQHGLLNEQLAALLPNHTQNGTIDAQVAAQWASAGVGQLHEADFNGNGSMTKPGLKRSYTFGTDDSFNNPSGYAAPYKPKDPDYVVHHALREVNRSKPGVPTIGSNGNGAHVRPVASNDDGDDDSEDATSEGEESERPSKKRRRGNDQKDSPRKKSRGGKGRKNNDDDNKKRRQSASQKLQRENLTEEQKRSNHILSEQKRRNLIKRGFDDLHDLVPEIRNGGLSKSSVLMEAGKFLEQIIQDNIAYSRVVGD